MIETNYAQPREHRVNVAAEFKVHATLPFITFWEERYGQILFYHHAHCLEASRLTDTHSRASVYIC